MKKMIFTLSLMIAGFALYAQDEPKAERFPIHTISKDVQKIQFRNSVYVPSAAVAGENPQLTVSKGVYRNQSSRVYGRIKTTGTPSHVISKGVAKMQYEKQR
jgi:hypothetical protein